MFAAMIRASERWRALEVTGFERRQMDVLRRELDQNYEAENDISQPSVAILLSPFAIPKHYCRKCSSNSGQRKRNAVSIFEIRFSFRRVHNLRI